MNLLTNLPTTGPKSQRVVRLRDNRLAPSPATYPRMVRPPPAADATRDRPAVAGHRGQPPTRTLTSSKTQRPTRDLPTAKDPKAAKDPPATDPPTAKEVIAEEGTALAKLEPDDSLTTRIPQMVTLPEWEGRPTRQNGEAPTPIRRPMTG